MSDLTVYQTAVSPEWIDYNGHLRDAYYVVIGSLATDGLMDRLGLDEAYRTRTQCTLYSVELHMHWLHEVKAADHLEVDAHLLATDAKRLQVGLDIRVVGQTSVAATAEFMLLHIRQGDTPGTAPFPADVLQRVEAYKALAGNTPWAGPASRALMLKRG